MQSFTEFYQTSDYAAFDQDVRRGGTYGLSFLDVKQGAIEMTDPAMSDVAFVTALGGNGQFETDFGDGWRSHQIEPASIIDLQPPFQECHFRLPPVHLRFAILPEAQLRKLLDERGLVLAALEGFSGQFQNCVLAAAAIQDMWRFAQMDDPATNLIIDGLMMNMIGHMLHALDDTNALKPAAAVGDARLRRVLDYIEDHLSDPLCVGDLASVACMSATQFSRSFKAAIGASPAKYVTQRRCCRADELLRRTNLPVTSIAPICGFRNVSYFCTVFKRETGHRPAELRA